MKKEQENAVTGLLERAKDLVNTMSETSSDMRVIKRNGMEVPFEPSRIIHAVSEANSCITDDNEGLSEMEILSITDNVIKQMRELNHTPNVEEIQNTVVHEIMKKGAYDVAELYIVYRYRRALARKANSTDDRILSLVDFDNEEVKQENSNKNPQIASTQRDYMAGEVSRDITKRLLLPDDIVEAHENGLIHFHDGDYFAQKIYNCFNKHTKFVTSEGVKEFADFKDGETVTVLDKDGEWRKATVRRYGKEPMQKVSMHSARSKAEFVCTKNHRWILHDGTVTTDLKCGDKLYGLVSKCTTADMIETKEQAIAFCIGFSLGDGMDCYQSKNKNDYVKVRLCGKKKGYAKYFELAGWRTGPITHPDSLEGDVLAMKKNAFKQSFLTLCGWRYMSLEGKQFLFAGYLAADGSFTTEWQASTADERVSMMIDEISALAGYHVSLKKEITHDTNYKNNARLINYTFRTQQPNNKLWCIDEIKPYRSGELKEAWCVEEPVTHSFTLEHGVVTGNCALMNLKDTLGNGTVITETMIESPKSFLTACNIATQLIAQTASNQYGGQTFSLAHLAPFVKVARNKWRKRLAADNEEQKLNMTDDQMEELVETRVKEEIKSGIQLIQYQLLTLMTTNGQTPFVSMFLYLGEAENKREEKDLAMLIEEVLVQRMEGIKNEKGVYVTPAFPKLLYVLDENNTSEDSEYWYLTELAAKCTAKRMVPDYISAKIMKKLKGDVYPCMGCVDGKSVIDYRFNGRRYVESFERAWARLSLVYDVKLQENGKDYYMDTTDVEIYDCKEKRYVKQYRMIRNTQNLWYKVSFTGGRYVDVTNDHPFEVIGKGVVSADEIAVGDMVYRENAHDVVIPQKHAFNIKMWLLGLVLCDGCYDRQMNIALGMDESDVAAKAVEAFKALGYMSETKEWHRGQKGDYQEVRTPDSVPLQQMLMSLFEGRRKIKRHIPDSVFSASYEDRMSFLAGMIDADGSVNNTEDTVRVQLGSTNEELALQQMMLANSVGINAAIYSNHYSKKDSGKIRYRVEFNCTKEITAYIVSSKKSTKFNENHKFYENVALSDDKCSVRVIEPYTELKYSYDVTTESEHFTVNGIYSHNCRSFLTPDRFTDAGVGNIAKAMDYDGKHKYYGRFNQGVVTLNLVDVACSSGGDMDRFWEILDERLELCHRALKLRHERLEGTPSDIAPVLFQHGVIARLKKGEKIDPLLHDGYSTISLGYAGLNETCMRMCHKSHTDPEAKPFAIAVMRALNDACAKWKEAENVDYSVYGTPLESTTYKFAKCLQKRFGIIKGVTDKNYITNSYHVHVTEEINAFDKLKFEAEFQELSPGGAISYVEVPNMQDNIPAVLSVIKYIYDNIMYAELNTKSDYCQACGYNGEIQIIEDEAGKLIWECPNCRNRDQNTMNVARRTCGYIGTQFWNQGRTQEIKDRVLHL